MWYARTTWQRSSVPGAAKLVTEHGHAKSQLQFSKYVPSTVQLMGTPPIRASKSSRSVLRSRARAFAPLRRVGEPEVPYSANYSPRVNWTEARALDRRVRRLVLGGPGRP